MLYLQNLLALSLEAAPWLVLGLVLGGLMKALIPTAFLQRHLSGEGVAAISKATILGAPLPLCSCGVIPAALGLRQGGASKPATAAFLVSTPETGVDSISVTYAMMGPFMAIARPVAALVSAFVAGSLVAIFDPEENPSRLGFGKNQDSNSKVSTCCSSEPAAEAVESCCSATTDEQQADSPDLCCSSDAAQAPSQVSPSQNKAWSLIVNGWGGIHYAFTELLGGIIFWLVIGMLFAAAAHTFLPPDFLTKWGSGITAMFIMLLAGIPMYICATASTPVAAGLMMAGISPGVALVFLLTGPATNVSTLGIIARELGKRSMWLYLVAVSVTAIAAGLLVDIIVDSFQIDIQQQLHAGHEGFPAWLQWATLLLLVVMALRKWPQKLFYNLRMHSR